MATLYLDVNSSIPGDLAATRRAFRQTAEEAERMKEKIKRAFNFDRVTAESVFAVDFARDIGRKFKFSHITAGFRSITIAADAAFRAMRAVAGVAAGIGTAFLDINSKVEQATVMLTSATGSIRAGEQAIEMLIQKAQKAPYSIDAMADSFIKFKVSGVRDAKGMFDSLIDAIAAFGGGTRNLNLATVAIQQMSAKGKISMEELRRQLAEQVPSAMKAMAMGMRGGAITIGELMDRVSKGLVSSNEGLTALQFGFQKLHAGAAEKRMETFAGAVTYAGTALQILALDIGKTNGSFGTITEFVRKAGEAVHNFRKSAEGKSIMESIAGKITDSLQKFIDDPMVIAKVFQYGMEAVDLFVSSLKAAYQMMVNVLQITDRLTGKIGFMEDIPGGTDDYMKIRGELIKINDLKKEINKPVDRSFVAVMLDNIKNWNPQTGFMNDETRNNVAEMMIQFAVNEESMKEAGPKIKAEVAELQRQIQEKLSSDSKPKFELDTTEAKQSLYDLMREFPDDPFLKVQKGLIDLSETFEGEVAKIIEEYAKISENIEKENQKILGMTLSLDQKLRGLDREGMKPGAAWRDAVKEIKEYRYQAAKAAKAGDFDSQLQYLEAAAKMADSLDTKGIKNIVSAETQRTIKRKQIKEIGDQIIKNNSRELEDLKKKKDAQEDLLKNKIKEVEDLAGSTRSTVEATEGIALAWVDVGGTMTKVAEDIAEEVTKLNDMLKDAKKELDYIASKAPQVSKHIAPTQYAPQYNVPGKASGGPVSQNRPYMVGEEGPELFVPNFSGNIIPNDRLKSKSADVVNLNLSINNGPKIPLSGTKTNIALLERELRERARFAS